MEGAVALAASLAFSIGGAITFCMARNRRLKKQLQREAILKGHAIWAVGKDGGPVFQWKPIGGER
jgi:hypothetical protein